MASCGIPAATTNVIEAPSHWFLESERFDRAGVRGRIAVLSLAAIHDDLADSWARAATSLREAGRLTDEDARRLRWLDAFGALIGNTDRHRSNILFFTEGSSLRLAPAFDQVSMLYAPAADGRCRRGCLCRTSRPTRWRSGMMHAARHAQLSGEQGSDDARLADDVRFSCAGNAELLTE